MQMTYEWVKKQINDYKRMLQILDEMNPDDQKLKTIWGATRNTLESVLKVMQIEMRGTHDHQI